MRKQAAFALSEIGSPQAVPALLEALKDASPDVREQAAFALGEIGDERANDALMAALKDGTADVRRQAAFALGQLAGRERDGLHPNPNPNPIRIPTRTPTPIRTRRGPSRPLGRRLPNRRRSSRCGSAAVGSRA